MHTNLPRITPLEVYERRCKLILNAGDDLNSDSMSRQDAKLQENFPPADTEEFNQLTADNKVVQFEFPEINVLFVRDPSEKVVSNPCMACALGYGFSTCYTEGAWHADGKSYEYPCEGTSSPRSPFLAYDLTPQSKKNGKKEYVPDRPEDFDFSKENWQSVKTMIGMR